MIHGHALAAERGQWPPAHPSVVLCPAGELADSAGLASGCGVGLTGAELVGVVVGLADDVPGFGVLDVFGVVLGAVGVRFPHVLSAAGRAGVGVLRGLEAAVALDVALLVTPGLTLELGLTLEVGLTLELKLTGAIGLAAELGGGVDGVDVAGGEAGELDNEAGEAAADDCGQDAIGVGGCAAEVGTDPAPPVRALPPPPAAEVDALGVFWPSRADDTDEVSA